MLHYTEQIKNGISSLSSNLSMLTNSVIQLDYDLHTHVNHTAEELAQLQNHVKTVFNATTATVQLVHKILSSTMSADLQGVSSKLDAHTELLHTLSATTARLSTDHQGLEYSMSDMECLDATASLQAHRNLQNSLSQKLRNIQKDVNKILGP